jgi:hypothetical protein
LTNAQGWQQRWQQGNTDGVAIKPTDVPGVDRRGSKFVVVFRVDGPQRKQSADTMADARALKLKRDGQVRAQRRGPPCTSSACRGSIATRALGVTAFVPARAADSGGCW